MFVSENLSVNEKGHLTAGGADTVELAERYGTPLYVMDEALIRKPLINFTAAEDLSAMQVRRFAVLKCAES